MVEYLISNQNVVGSSPIYRSNFKQDIAQSGSALALEVSGRWFESNYPDQFTAKEVGLEAAIYNE